MIIISKEWTHCKDGLAKHSTPHRYINSDGIVIHSNTDQLKTSFRYAGEVPDYQRTERLLAAFGLLQDIRKKSKTDIEYYKNIQTAELNLIGKRDPSKFMLNSAKAVRRHRQYDAYLKAESFVYLMGCSRYNVLDWDIEIKENGFYNFMIQAEFLVLNSK